MKNQILNFLNEEKVDINLFKDFIKFNNGFYENKLLIKIKYLESLNEYFFYKNIHPSFVKHYYELYTSSFEDFISKFYKFVKLKGFS